MTLEPKADVFVTPEERAAQPVLHTVRPPLRSAPSDVMLDPAEIMLSIGEVAYDWRIDTDHLSWGINAAEVLGLDPDAIARGADYAKLVGAKSPETRAKAVLATERRDGGTGVPYLVQYCLRAGGAPDDELWVEDAGCWFADASGKPARAHGVVRVINDRRRQERWLDYLSRFDPLTGELNRWQLLQKLGDALEEANRYRTSCGFLLVAINNLDQLNESYGFNSADEVIAAVAKRIRSRMRGGDELGRYAGNRFGVVLRNCSPEDLEVAAERLMASIRDEMVPTSIGPVAVTVTAGGVTAPRHARTLDEVQVRAQETLGRAKAKRRGSFLAYRPSVEREALRQENVRVTDEIVAALNDRRIALVFEPVAETATRTPAFYECLMRLRRPDGTLLPANDIVPVAERLGLVRLLDHRVLELAVQELVAAPRLRASLNVSPSSTTDPDWWAGLDVHLRAHPGVAERLTIEITETAAIQDIDDTRGFVARVKDLGCRIAIDDFGAGYTSFRNLRKLGVDMVKIDGAFVRNMLRSDDDRAFVQTLIDLARRLRLQTVAEWVQDEEAAAILAQWGCDYLQGALLGLASPERPWAGSLNLCPSRPGGRAGAASRRSGA